MRIDAEAYNKEYVLARQFIRNTKHTTLAQECSVIKKGIFDINSSCYCNDGVPFVRISNLKNMMIDTADIIHIPKTEHLRNNKTALIKGDVVLSKTATASASIVNIATCNVSQDIVAIKLKGGSVINSYYLVAFLNTKYGLEQMQRRFTGNIQMHLNLDECKNEVLIPVFSTDFQEMIKSKLEKAIELFARSRALYSSAQTLLLRELCLEGWRPAEEVPSVSVRRASFVQGAGRWDAEYYQGKYDEVEGKIKAYSGGWKAVGDCFCQNKTLCTFEKGAYNYIEIGDVNTGDGSVACNLIETGGLPDNAKIALCQGDLIVSKVRPYRGAVAIVDIDKDDLVASGAFTVLQESSSYKKEVLQVLLRTVPYKEWLLKWNVGTSYPVIKDDDVLRLPLPILPDHVQQRIAQAVQEAARLRRGSAALLEEAKRAVEREIEGG